MTVQSDAPTLDELREQMQIIRAEKDAGRKATMRTQFFSDARHYLSVQLKGTNGLVTREMLNDADALYDIDGFPTRLAGILGYDLHDLQDALGREIERSCERCQQSFTVRERRRLGGYTPNSSRYCPRCERIVSQQIQQTWEARAQTAKQNTARAVQVDAAIRRAPNPLEIAIYRAKLLAFLRYWQEDDIRKFGPSFSYSYQRHSALLHLPLMFPPMRIGVMTYAGLTAYALAPDGSASSPCKAGSRRADRLQAIR